jgi:segregation and condensation protein B
MTETQFDEIKIKVEAVLFSYADWVTPNEIKEALNMDSGKLIENSLKELEQKYKEGYSFHIEESEDGKWRMTLKEEYQETISELVSGVEIPKPVLKVLSIIAYEQPVTKTRLSEIVGRYVKPEVDYLYKAKFINYEKQGIGKYYRVTKKFFDYFKIDNEEEFREQANKSMKTFLEEPTSLQNNPGEDDDDEEENLDNVDEMDEEDIENEKKSQSESTLNPESSENLPENKK